MFMSTSSPTLPGDSVPGKRARLAMLHRSPYQTAFLRLPPSIQSILMKRGFTPAQQDGELLRDLCFDPDTHTHTDYWADLLLACESILPVPIDRSDYQLIMSQLEYLCNTASDGKQSELYSQVELEIAIAYKHECTASYTPLPGVQRAQRPAL